MSLYDSQVGVLYQITDNKPDKKYSILPTVLDLISDSDLKNKIVLDLGSGTGFFSHHIANLNPRMVIGIDNSILKIGLASGKEKYPNVLHTLGDIFYHDLPPSDLVLAAFVLNYAENVVILKNLFQRIYESLNPGGEFIGVVDLPSGKDLTHFGAKKHLSSDKDGAPMFIHLYDDEGSETCTLEAIYFKKETFEQLAEKVGFSHFEWCKPMVTDKGKEKYPNMNWDEYLNNPELGYFVIMK